MKNILLENRKLFVPKFHLTKKQKITLDMNNKFFNFTNFVF